MTGNHMDEQARAERLADSLDRLLDGEAVRGDAALAPLLGLARQLKAEAPTAEPDPDFQARLRRELVGAEAQAGPSQAWPIARLNGRSSLSPYLTRLAHLRRSWRPGARPWGLGAAAVLLVFVAAIALIGPSLRRSGEEGKLVRLPSLLSVSAAYAEQLAEEVGSMRYHFGNVTLKLEGALPQTPERAKVYRQRREPIDEAGARDLAGRLGIKVAQVVEDRDYDVFVVTGEDGRLVVSRTFRGYFTFEASPAASDPLMPAAPAPRFAPPGAAVTPPPGAAEAESVARRFLEAAGLLDFPHVVETADDAPPGATPLYGEVTFVPTADGRPVRGLGVVVTVGRDGRVMAVRSNRAGLEALQAYPILSADEAFQGLQAKQLEPFELRVGTASGGSASAAVTRARRLPGTEAAAPVYRVGERVELEGLVSAVVYESKDGRRRYLATMTSQARVGEARIQFRLVGSEVPELARLDQQHARVWGRVEEIREDLPEVRLRVERFEKLYPNERLVTLLGRLEVEGEGDEATLVVREDDGTRYLLERPAGSPLSREHAGKRAIVEGRTTERTSPTGYPVLELSGLSMGTDVDQMTDLSTRPPRPRPQVIPEREPLLQGEALVERFALEYYATSAADSPARLATASSDVYLLVQPIYSLAGTHDGGKGSFGAYLQAVGPEYVEQLR